MTTLLSAQNVSKELMARFPDMVVESSGSAVLVKSQALLEVAAFLKATPGLDLDYLTLMTVVDYLDYFEVVYLLTSLQHNHSLTLKTRLFDRDNPSLASVVGLWKGADYQEREVYDMFGIKFVGHPNLKRLFLWEGFQGYPMRKDYL
ncbi:MAG: NADH-quinone oxidoreductase subunit C [Dehalococcoidia bacterium]|nr:NADH-quinone oxidoreductase subunit C [Dehalococcoidia bacterium]